MIHNNIIETIGNTPMVKLNKITSDIEATIVAKLEYFNPGSSVKDRMAVRMIEDAEKNGLIKPGGTIIEGTSGNTGMGLALACIVKGYKLICTTNDKQSKEKVDILRAVGAEVVVCPTNVAPEDPRSYYSVAKRLNKEIPNSYYPNQYDNLSNRQAHYESTGPEIWEQTNGKLTHFVVGVGTGGTISGVAKYLKEKNPNIQIWGIDSYGSVFKKYHETGIFDEKEIYSYITEGIGEDILPQNVDFGLIDHFEKVTDKDGAIYARRLAKEEGIFSGYSAGSAIAGVIQLKEKLKPTDLVVVLLHDSGSRYIGKVYNDDWMNDRGFLQKSWRAIDLIQNHKHQKLIALSPKDSIREAIDKFKKYEISQIPVIDNGKNVGSLTDNNVFAKIIENNSLMESSVADLMQTPFPEVNANDYIDEISKKITKNQQAVLVRLPVEGFQIITKYDLIDAI